MTKSQEKNLILAFFLFFFTNFSQFGQKNTSAEFRCQVLFKNIQPPPSPQKNLQIWHPTILNYFNQFGLKSALFWLEFGMRETVYLFVLVLNLFIYLFILRWWVNLVFYNLVFSPELPGLWHRGVSTCRPCPCLSCGPEGRIYPMTCQSSESTETIEGDRRADNNTGAVESDESRIAAAMKELRNTGRKDLRLHSLHPEENSWKPKPSRWSFHPLVFFGRVRGGTSKTKKAQLSASNGHVQEAEKSQTQQIFL